MMEIFENEWVENKLLVDKSYYFDIVRCPACNSVSELHFCISKFEFLICKNCRTIFSKQRPTKIGADVLYNSIISDYYRKKIEIPNLLKSSGKRYSMSDELLKLVTRQLQVFIKGKVTLLDYASGLGSIAEYYRNSGMFSDVYIYEINDLSISFVKKNYPNLKFYNEKNKVDVVILYASLEHFSDPFELLNTITKNLRTGAIIQVLVPYMGFIVRNFHPQYFSLCLPGFHVNYFTKKGLEELGKRLNLSIVSTRYHGSEGQYFQKFLYRKKGYFTKKIVYDKNNNVEQLQDGFIVNGNYTRRLGNLFIRRISTILNYANIYRIFDLLNKGKSISIVYRKN